MRRQGRRDDLLRVGVQDRPADRERVAGGPQRRGDHDAVAREADHALPVRFDVDDHLPGPAAHEHEVVEGLQRLRRRPGHVQSREVAAPGLALRDLLQAVLQPIRGHGRQRAEAAAGDTHHRRADRRGGVQGRQRRPVAADGDDEVASGRGLRRGRAVG